MNSSFEVASLCSMIGFCLGIIAFIMAIVGKKKKKVKVCTTARILSVISLIIFSITLAFENDSDDIIAFAIIALPLLLILLYANSACRKCTRKATFTESKVEPMNRNESPVFVEAENNRMSVDTIQPQAEPILSNESQERDFNDIVLSGRKSTCRITAEGIDFQNKDESFFAPYCAIENFYKFGTLYSFLYKGKEYYMDQNANHDTMNIQDAFAYAMTCWEKACATRPAVRPLRTDGEAVYVAETTFMILKVYNEWCTLTAKRNAGNLLIMDKFFNGEKKYYYSDLTSVQFREPGKVTDGYLEFEYPGSRSGKNDNSYSSENSISYGKQHTPLMKEIYTFIDGRIRECKNGQNQQAIQVSAADELKKYKELLDMGAITQEEFDAKKKQLLGL